MQLSIIVPTYNEAPNITELVRRIAAATAQVPGGVEAEILFVDDSTDATPDVIRGVAASAPLPVRLIHRDRPTGGLGGAVIQGLAEAAASSGSRPKVTVNA